MSSYRNCKVDSHNGNDNNNSGTSKKSAINKACKAQLTLLAETLANDRSYTKTNPMVVFVHDCMERKVVNAIGNCREAIKKAYFECQKHMVPIMKQVAAVRTLIDDKYLIEE
jgi:hypothetical protein